ncbi:Uncharacterised protein [Mycobacteroides abscessus subsp. abscessus]|nr:Uncharacterised protein [Mycobacteroides abscessus subsp. abscessus]
MRDFVADDHQTDSLAVEGLLLRPTDPAGDVHEVVEEALVEVGPLRDLGTRDDHGVAVGERGDVEEGHTFVVLVDEGARDLAVDDLREDGGHGAVLLRRWRRRCGPRSRSHGSPCVRPVGH